MTEGTQNTIKYALIRQYGYAKRALQYPLDEADQAYYENEINEIVEAYAETQDLPMRIAKEILDNCK